MDNEVKHLNPDKDMEHLREHFESVYERFEFNERIPEQMREALNRYVYGRIQPGGFLTAVLENDFKGAAGRGDETNVRYFKQYALYICNCMPGNCHGSPEIVAAWLKGER